MSAQGMLLTVLATQIAEAVAKDETPEVGGCDISAGMFGPYFSTLLRELVGQLDERAALLAMLMRLRDAGEWCYSALEFRLCEDGHGLYNDMMALIAKVEGGAA